MRTHWVATLCAGVAVVLAVPVAQGHAATSGSPLGAPRAAACPSTAETTTTAVIKTIPVGGGPQGVAVDSADDSVYVTNALSDTLSVISGRTATVRATVGGLSLPLGVAVNAVDDTLYVANVDDSSVTVLSGRSLTALATLPIGGMTAAVAVDQGDDTVYATRWNGNVNEGAVVVIDGARPRIASVVPVWGNVTGTLGVHDLGDRVYATGTNATSVSVIDGRTASVEDTIALSGDLRGLAVHQADDTLYVADYPGNTLTLVDGRSGTVARTIPTQPGPWGVVLAESTGRVYVSNGLVDQVSIFDQRTGELTMPPIAVGDFPVAMGVDESGANAGLVYVANSDDSSVSVLGSVQPGLAPSAGDPGSAVRIAVDAPQAEFALDAQTVARVCFEPAAGGPATWGESPSAEPGNTWTVRVPDVSAGAYRVVVEFDGGLSALAGEFTVASILITGTRDGGDPAIVRVEGAAPGLAGGRVTPMVRFPGQARYSPGVGVRTVATDGSFTWQRKTNRKVYVYFTHGAIRSNRVIVSAR